MFRQLYLGAAILGLLLAACTPSGSQPTEVPAPTHTSVPPTTAPTVPPATPTADPNAPVTAVPGGEATPAPQLWDPQPSDQALEQGPAYIEGAEVLVLESFPVQIMLNLSGSLPTPCHQLRLTVAKPDAQNQIAVEVYSVVDPGQICTQNLAPFDVAVPLGSFPSGDYTILVNGTPMGEFTA